MFRHKFVAKQRRGQRITKIGALHAPNVLPDGDRRDAQSAGDLPMVEGDFEMQAQHFTSFTRGQLWVCLATSDKTSKVPRLTRVASSCGHCPAWREVRISVEIAQTFARDFDLLWMVIVQSLLYGPCTEWYRSCVRVRRR